MHKRHILCIVFQVISGEVIILIRFEFLHYFLNRFMMDGALRRLGRNTALEPSLGALDVFACARVSEILGSEVLGMRNALVKTVLFRKP
jgi:hypothetical protein